MRGPVHRKSCTCSGSRTRGHKTDYSRLLPHILGRSVEAGDPHEMGARSAKHQGGWPRWSPSCQPLTCDQTAKRALRLPQLGANPFQMCRSPPEQPLSRVTEDRACPLQSVFFGKSSSFTARSQVDARYDNLDEILIRQISRPMGKVVGFLALLSSARKVRLLPSKGVSELHVCYILPPI